MSKRNRSESNLEDLFDTLSPENENESVKRSILKEYQDLTPSDPNRVYFNVPASIELGTDLGSCFVEVDFQVFKETGKPLTDDDKEKIQPSNDFFNAMFSSVHALINNAEVGTPMEQHPQVALLHNLLDYDDAFQDSVLSETNIWMKDYQYPASNPLIRHRFIEGSKRVKLYGRLNNDVFTTKRLLLPNVSLQIKMKRTSPAYCLIRSENVAEKYDITVHSCKLIVRRVQFYDAFLEKIEKSLQGRMVHYPYIQTILHRFEIPKGSTFIRSLSTGWGPAPKRAFFAICEPDSIEGFNWQNNPMIFPAAQYEVNYVEFFSKYDDTVRHLAYEPDFPNKIAGRSYAELVRVATDGFRTGRSPALTGDDFNGQYGLFAINDMFDSTDLAVKVGFNKETTRTLMGLIFVQREAYFSITGSGGIKNGK